MSYLKPPHRTPRFDDAGNLTRPWMIFLSNLPSEIMTSPGVTANIKSEIPTGAIDGVNTIFLLSNTPTNVMGIFWNGLKLKKGKGYLMTGKTITFQPSYIPQVGDDVEAVYYF